MHAALVTRFEEPPRYADVPEPVARSKKEIVVEVLASALHPRVRSQADGSHYTSTRTLPLIPGIDAVVRAPDGKTLYTVLDDTLLGTMAQRTVTERDRCVVLPKGVDPVRVAAAMNPLMSSWMALKYRIDFKKGQSILILGATGTAGGMAIQVAKRFKASRVIAAGRDMAKLARLRELGADEVVMFDDLAKAADVDVVLDYVWGQPTANAMMAMLPARDDRGKQLTWVQIGSVSAPDAAIPSAALRQARLSIVGSGIGSVDGRDFVKELPSLASAIQDGGFEIHARAVPLAQVETAWNTPTSERIVFVP